jgi:hypothetical protein
MTSVLCQGFCVREGNAAPSDACWTVAPASTSWPWCPSCTRSTLPCLLPPQPLPQLQVTARSCSPWKPSRRCSTWLSWGPERLLPRRPESPAPDRGPRSRFASSYASRGSVLTRFALAQRLRPQRVRQVHRCGSSVRGSNPAKAARSTRSAGANRDRPICRRSTATSCLKTSSSRSLDASPRPHRTISANARPTSRYTNERTTSSLPATDLRFLSPTGSSPRHAAKAERATKMVRQASMG